MTFKSGVDRHVYYRVNPTTNFVRVMHFAYPSGYSIFNGSTSLGFSRGYVAGVKYHYKAIVTTNNVKIYESSDINPNLNLVSDVNQSIAMPAGFIGLGSNPGSNTLTETWFDNVRVTTLDHVDPVPEPGLNVPLFKQTDLLWASDIYDSAQLWTTGSPTIGRWGCAITSAVMVLNYNNITKLPDGSNLNPSSLNSYLLSTPGGYKRNGATNWEKIAAMTKMAKSKNPNFSFDALQYLRGNNSLNAVENDIQNNIPDILEVSLSGGQHFVVAKNVVNSNVSINDPGFNRSDLSQYQNTFNSTRRFIPSNTDLSYLVFDVDPGVNIALKDSEGNLISEGEIEFPIADPLGLLANSKGALKIISYAEPSDGEYSLEVSSNSLAPYTIDGYLYDQNGDTKLFKKLGVTNAGENDEYNINFAKDEVIQSQIENNYETTLETLENDVKDLYSIGHITKKGSYNFLLNKIEQATKYLSSDPDRSKAALNDMISVLQEDKKRGIDDFASQLIIDQVEIILSNLN